MIPHECGLLALCRQKLKDDVDFTDYLINGLICLQHRGQDSFGYSFNNITYKHNGLIADSTSDIRKAIRYMGHNVIAHLRYQTSGKTIGGDAYIQPLHSRFQYNVQQGIATHRMSFYLAHNGNIINLPKLDQILREVNPDIDHQELDKLRQLNHDSHYLVKIIEHMKGDMKDRLSQLMELVGGVYCLLVRLGDVVYIVRDRFGVRPLSIGVLEKDDNLVYVVASETVAFPEGTILCRDVHRGEIIKLTPQNGFETVYQMDTSAYEARHCLFEYLYFLRPETTSNKFHTATVRSQYGFLLASKEKNIYRKGNLDVNKYPYSDLVKHIYIETPINFSQLGQYVVVGSPFSGILVGQQYATNMEIPYQQIIVKQKNIRSFILKDDESRRQACYHKFKFNEDEIKGKNIILVDDSIVRGNTTRIMIQVLKELGANEIHIRIGAPPIKNPCYFGIDIPNRQELIANKLSLPGILAEIGADSLIYLDMDDINGLHRHKICHSCFSGEYDSKMLEW